MLEPTSRRKGALRQAVSVAPRDVLAGLIQALVDQATVEQLEVIELFVCQLPQEAEHRQDTRRKPDESRTLSRAGTHAKRARAGLAGLTQVKLSLPQVSVDLLSGALFPLLSLGDHCRLGRTCWRLMSAGGVAVPGRLHWRPSACHTYTHTHARTVFSAGAQLMLACGNDDRNTHATGTSATALLNSAWLMCCSPCFSNISTSFSACCSSFSAS